MSEQEGQPPQKRPSDSNEVPVCSKPKKCRRGKKKKFRNRESNQQGPDNMDQEGFKIPLPPNNASKQLPANPMTKKRNRKILIRPVDVPKAPENSTQFIIDDHDECHLYFSFENPNSYDRSSAEAKTENCEEDDAAFQDIDYQYESLQDVDNSAYYQQDFETNYFNMRYEEILRLPRQEILNSIENLETRVKELEDKLCEQDPSLALEQLQHKLLQLQEENMMLTERNLVLKKALENKTSSGETSSTLLDNSSQSADSESHYCEQCNTSPCSSHHSGDENEECMMEELYSQDSSYLPDYNAQLDIVHEVNPDVSSDDYEEDTENKEEYHFNNPQQYVSDYHMLEDNYRAHHISDDVSDTSSDNQDDQNVYHDDDHGEEEEFNPEGNGILQNCIQNNYYSDDTDSNDSVQSNNQDPSSQRVDNAETSQPLQLTEACIRSEQEGTLTENFMGADCSAVGNCSDDKMESINTTFSPECEEPLQNSIHVSDNEIAKSQNQNAISEDAVTNNICEEKESVYDMNNESQVLEHHENVP